MGRTRETTRRCSEPPPNHRIHAATAPRRWRETMIPLACTGSLTRLGPSRGLSSLLRFPLWVRFLGLGVLIRVSCLLLGTVPGHGAKHSPGPDRSLTFLRFLLLFFLLLSRLVAHSHLSVYLDFPLGPDFLCLSPFHFPLAFLVNCLFSIFLFVPGGFWGCGGVDPKTEILVPRLDASSFFLSVYVRTYAHATTTATTTTITKLSTFYYHFLLFSSTFFSPC
ncbi:hypothetical protein DM02DRAFT_240306 [Periconia macrospinosa]|uniref:Uncharacterized protein n=1 Tax=Periconia macrospinosa TaxID=97972 RepID=A0A2V1DZW3_9PLEO|nr:hypothetical protein DM02DRAFT_240306 [Periconia macrospinosa]